MKTKKSETGKGAFVDKTDAPVADSKKKDTVRKCIVTGELLPKSDMIRFCLSPDNKIVPDLTGTLPAKGIWVRADKDAVTQAVEKKLFNKAARRRKEICTVELVSTLERLLRKRCLELLGVARRSGLVVSGFEKVSEAVSKGKIGYLLEAVDGAADGREKIERVAKNIPVLRVFNAAETGEALGREACVHAALKQGGMTKTFLLQLKRYASFCHLAEENVPSALFDNEAETII